MLLRNGKNKRYNLKLIEKENPWWYMYTKEFCVKNKIDEKHPFVYLFNQYTVSEMIEFYLPLFGLVDFKHYETAV